MRNREFRTTAAAALRAAMLVVGLLGLAFGAVLSIRAQGAAGGPNSPAGQSVVTAYLEYKEVSYSFVNWGLQLSKRSSSFNKEPAFGRNAVTRGTIKVGGGTNSEMAFAWDRTARKLYLDLNRNLDLTDDPAGVFLCQRGSGDLLQTFTNVHLPFRPTPNDHPVLVDINLYNYGSANGSAEVRSFWQGKVTLQGEEWQVGLLENPFAQRPASESGNLLLRPWAERSRPYSVYSGSLDAVAFSRNLFLGGRAYQLLCTNEVQEGGTRIRVAFTEEQPKLGELKITGDFVQRLTLEGGPYLVVLDKPAKTVKVPLGRYHSTRACVQKGEVQASLDARTRAAEGGVVVSEKAPAVLTVGGPLTNSVSINRQGRKLSLNYQLVGAGGAYQILNQDRSHPPEFAVYQGDKKIASGKFEFG